MTEEEKAEEAKHLIKLHADIVEKYPLPPDVLFRIESIAMFSVWVDKEKGPTNDNHIDYHMLLNSMHLLAYDLLNGKYNG